MFTGIVQGVLSVVTANKSSNFLQLAVDFSHFTPGVPPVGASVAINGVCLTVASVVGEVVWFDVMNETLQRTNLGVLTSGSSVNVERSLKMGDEIGGHFVSGHVSGTAKIIQIEQVGENTTIMFQLDRVLSSRIQAQGFIALDGVSLTPVEVDPIKGTVTVGLIPTTWRNTLFGQCKVEELVNVEVSNS